MCAMELFDLRCFSACRGKCLTSAAFQHDEMDRVNRDWATEFADGSLAVNVQRQYGNYTICQYIIQSGRFDEGLLHYIMG